MRNDLHWTDVYEMSSVFWLVKFYFLINYNYTFNTEKIRCKNMKLYKMLLVKFY